MAIKDDVENIVASACDGTWNGLEGAYFPEYNNPPQKLADKLVAYIERLLTSRAVDEGDSAPLQAESTPEHSPIEEAGTTPALRN